SQLYVVNSPAFKNSFIIKRLVKKMKIHTVLACFFKFFRMDYSRSRLRHNNAHVIISLSQICDELKCFESSNATSDANEYYFFHGFFGAELNRIYYRMELILGKSF